MSLFKKLFRLYSLATFACPRDERNKNYVPKCLDNILVNICFLFEVRHFFTYLGTTDVFGQRGGILLFMMLFCSADIPQKE